jgi:hypothetical protein
VSVAHRILLLPDVARNLAISQPSEAKRSLGAHLAAAYRATPQDPPEMPNVADQGHSFAPFDLDFLLKQSVDPNNSVLLIPELLIVSS